MYCNTCWMQRQANRATISFKTNKWRWTNVAFIAWCNLLQKGNVYPGTKPAHIRLTCLFLSMAACVQNKIVDPWLVTQHSLVRAKKTCHRGVSLGPRYKRRLLKLLLVTLQNVSSQLTECNYDWVTRSWKCLHANVASDGWLDTMRKQNQILHWKVEATSDNINGPLVLTPPNLIRKHDARHSRKLSWMSVSFGHGPHGKWNVWCAWDIAGDSWHDQGQTAASYFHRLKNRDAKITWLIPNHDV